MERNRKEYQNLDKNHLFEQLLVETGGWGRFQIVLVVLTLILSMSCSFNHLSTNYTAFAPPFSCNGNDQFNATCPEDGLILEQCPNLSFDQSIMRRSIVTDFKLVCDRSSYVTMSNSSYMAGVLILNLLAGFFSDHFGRRKVLLTACFIHVLASYATVFASSYWFYIIVRFIVGGSIHGAWSTAFIIMNELGIISRRGLIAGVLSGGWTIGSITMTPIAYVLRNWVHMQLTFAIFTTSSIVFYFLMPETPRWLLLNGKYQECEEVYRTIAKRNRVDLTSKHSNFEEYFKQLCKILRDEKEKENPKLKTRYLFGEWISFLKFREYRKRLLLLLIPWFAVGISSYGIHFSLSFVQYDIFVLSLIKDAATVLSVVILTGLYDRVYRTPLMLISYCIGGLFGLSIVAIPLNQTMLRVVTYMFAQGVITGSFVLADEIAAEVVSTDSRSTTFVVADGVSKFGTVLAPFVVLLGNINPDLPQAIFGSIMIIGSLAFLCTQETKDQPLMQTVQDLEMEEKRTMVGYCMNKINRKS